MKYLLSITISVLITLLTTSFLSHSIEEFWRGYISGCVAIIVCSAVLNFPTNTKK